MLSRGKYHARRNASLYLVYPYFAHYTPDAVARDWEEALGLVYCARKKTLR